jgi:hypothetical protein
VDSDEVIVILLGADDSGKVMVFELNGADSDEVIVILLSGKLERVIVLWLLWVMVRVWVSDTTTTVLVSIGDEFEVPVRLPVEDTG